MFFTQLDMINNSIKLAQYKLTLHKELGSKSELNIFQVAQLMDTIKFGGNLGQSQKSSIFYSIGSN
jgi:hypothetical protein